ncbi:MAG: hypothetical protein AAF797_00205 [Planctomycetota bacterium]
MPLTGYDRFGPFNLPSTFDTLDPLTPTQRLDAGEDPFDTSTLPDPQGQYLVRRIDAQGRSDAGLTTLPAATLPHSTTPAWPDAPGWPVLRLGTQVLIPLTLKTPLSPSALLALENDADPQQQPPTTVSPQPGQTRLMLALPVPPVATRFRWVLTEPGHSAAATPWSMPVSPAAPIQA